ncbi:MAG: hypothetical protein GH151_10380 [Bacteroidetes bacterium]|nr:hypothetical protein [Bacteroidota bacterium]
MTPNELGQAAIQKLNKRITNEVFLIIQNDREFMYEYLRLVEAKGLDTVNQSIGKEVKKEYGLTNIDDREDNPSCTLIQSHQKFE